MNLTAKYQYYFSPLEDFPARSNKLVRLTCLVLLVLYLRYMWFEFAALLDYLSLLSKVRFGDIVYLIYNIFYIPCLILFWNKTRIGWYLITMLITYECFLEIYGLATASVFDDGFFGIINCFGKEFNPYPPAIRLIIYAALLYLMAYKPLLNSYGFKRNDFYTAVGISAVLTGLWYSGIF